MRDCATSAQLDGKLRQQLRLDPRDAHLRLDQFTSVTCSSARVSLDAEEPLAGGAGRVSAEDTEREAPLVRGPRRPDRWGHRGRGIPSPACGALVSRGTWDCPDFALKREVAGAVGVGQV